MNDIVATLSRQEGRRVFSTLLRLLGSFDSTEEALHDARRATRRSAAGDFIPLEAQDRSLWDRGAIAEGCALVEAALSQHGFGAYALQAAITALHAEASSTAVTDWGQIVGLYDAHLRIEPSPVVALDRAVAVAMRDGPEAGLALIEPLLPALPGCHAAPAAAADLRRRAGRLSEAGAYDRSAADLARHEHERRFLLQRLAEVGAEGTKLFSPGLSKRGDAI